MLRLLVWCGHPSLLVEKRNFASRAAAQPAGSPVSAPWLDPTRGCNSGVSSGTKEGLAGWMLQQIHTHTHKTSTFHILWFSSGTIHSNLLSHVGGDWTDTVAREGCTTLTDKDNVTNLRNKGQNTSSKKQHTHISNQKAVVHLPLSLLPPPNLSHLPPLI